MNVITRDKSVSIIRVMLLVFVLAGAGAVVAYYQLAPHRQGERLLRVGVLPDQSPYSLRRSYKPLLDHLAAQTGLKTRLIIPSDYADIISMFRQGEIDLAHMGGLVYVQAQAEPGAEALVMREIDTRFTTWFIARPELAQSQLSALRGSNFVFGNKLSTSGHLMPRHFLQQQWDVEPESFFTEVGYSGAHDKTVFMVRDGRYDVGAVSSAIVRQMIDDGRLASDELQVLWQTPPYPNYVWAVQPDMELKLKTRLRNAFLQLDPEEPDEGTILTNLGARVFLPAGHEDFAILSDIAGGRGLLQVAAP